MNENPSRFWLGFVFGAALIIWTGIGTGWLDVSSLWRLP